MSVWKSMWQWVDKKSVPILITSGILGWFSSVILAIKATPRAMEDIEAYKQVTGHQELTVAQKFEASWQNYIWSAISAGVGTACLIAAAKSSNNKITALLTACDVAQNSVREFSEYRKALAEQIGEKKEQEIYNKSLEQEVAQNPPPKTMTQNYSEAIIEGTQPVPICYDCTFGRYFYASYDAVAAAVNRIGEKINGSIGGFASYNDFYDELGVPTVDHGEHIGWSTETGIPRIPSREAIQYTGTPNGTPCWILRFDNPPQYEYNFFRG